MAGDHAALREVGHAAGARPTWKEHLAAMDYLRQGIHLRGYAQKNPKQEYKREAFEMFTGLLEAIKTEVIGCRVRSRCRSRPRSKQKSRKREFQFTHDEFTFVEDEPA